LIANPILQSLVGITIVGSTLTFIASSIIVGAVVTALTFIIILKAKEAVAINNENGFILTIYAVSFVMFSIYANPIQIALVGHAIMIMTPMFSNISFGATTGAVAAFIITKIYKATEETAIPALIEPYKTAEHIQKSVTNAATITKSTLGNIARTLSYFR